MRSRNPPLARSSTTHSVSRSRVLDPAVVAWATNASQRPVGSALPDERTTAAGRSTSSAAAAEESATPGAARSIRKSRLRVGLPSSRVTATRRSPSGPDEVDQALAAGAGRMRGLGNFEDSPRRRAAVHGSHEYARGTIHPSATRRGRAGCPQTGRRRGGARTPVCDGLAVGSRTHHGGRLVGRAVGEPGRAAAGGSSCHSSRPVDGWLGPVRPGRPRARATCPSAKKRASTSSAPGRDPAEGARFGATPPQGDRDVCAPLGYLQGLQRVECVRVPQRQGMRTNRDGTTSGVRPRRMPSTWTSAPRAAPSMRTSGLPGAESALLCMVGCQSWSAFQSVDASPSIRSQALPTARLVPTTPPAR